MLLTALEADGTAIISWIEETDKAHRLMVRAVSPAGVAGPALQVAEGSRSSLGYPKVLRAGTETWIAWGDAKAGIKTARLKH